MKKTTIAQVAVIALASIALAGLLAACSSGSSASSASGSSATSNSASGSSASSATSGTVVSLNIPDNSILRFDNDEGAAKLIADMEAGRTPTNCNVLYDTMGARPDVDVTDPNTIDDIYILLSKVIVEGPSTMSMTDSYHHVIFTLQDGTKVGYRFEGAGILVKGSSNYAVSNSGQLWTLVQKIQDDYMSKKSSKSNS